MSRPAIALFLIGCLIFLAVSPSPVLAGIPSAASKSSQKRDDLPLRAAIILGKFEKFESDRPSRSLWEAKRREVLRYLRSVFDAEAAQANLERAVAVQRAARALKARRYVAYSGSPVLAGAPSEP